MWFKSFQLQVFLSEDTTVGYQLEALRLGSSHVASAAKSAPRNPQLVQKHPSIFIIIIILETLESTEYFAAFSPVTASVSQQRLHQL